MNDSPRMAWVVAHVDELIAIAARFGARDVRLCGSVARGDDHDKSDDRDESDLDLFVWDFDEGSSPRDARQRAEGLVKAFRAMAPFDVDVVGIPGWFIDPPHESSMRGDSIKLSELVG